MNTALLKNKYQLLFCSKRFSSWEGNAIHHSTICRKLNLTPRVSVNPFTVRYFFSNVSHTVEYWLEVIPRLYVYVCMCYVCLCLYMCMYVPGMCVYACVCLCMYVCTYIQGVHPPEAMMHFPSVSDSPLFQKNFLNSVENFPNFTSSRKIF